MRLCVASAVAWLTAAAAAGPSSVDAFLSDLQRACERGDRRAVAAMVQYPIKVMASGLTIPVKDRAEFVRYWDLFFTDEMLDAIDAAARTPHRVGPGDVVALPRNAMRVSAVGGQYRIVGMFVPGSSGKVRGARRGTKRLEIAEGRPTVYDAGTLAAGERESYVVAVPRNALLEVRVDGVFRRDIVARVTDAATGTALDGRARDGTRVWAGRVPASGDYRIVVTREATAGASVLTYTLAVTIR